MGRKVYDLNSTKNAWSVIILIAHNFFFRGYYRVENYSKVGVVDYILTIDLNP